MIKLSIELDREGSDPYMTKLRLDRPDMEGCTVLKYIDDIVDN
jgi:hypothetical protein